MEYGEKYVWKLPEASLEQALTIAATYTLSLPIAQTLVTRGIISREQLDTYLFSVFERDVEHPSRLRDAQKAVDRIIKAVDQGEKILIAGDYDVDGITSSALLLVCLIPLGAHINFFLPNRVKDGYGLSVKTVERAVASGYTLIITVDNGITAFEPARKARQLGIDLIITDHHRPHDELPDAYAIVNPNRVDCDSRFKCFAGVGVIFKVLSLLYECKSLSMPAKAYELLLLGTIADVVPLIGENRFWVRHGLHHVNSTSSLSLHMLKANGRITKQKISSLDIGFSITPQINALGRLEDARQGVRFLIGADEQEVKEVGALLHTLNETRKDIERTIFAEIKADIDAGIIDITKERIIFVVGKRWQPGVIGLVASRLVAMYGRPALLFYHTQDGGLAKGSCRSIPAFNMFNALHDCKDIIEQFGGHVMAAGLSIKAERLSVLK
jgi:single-stranded-DNA-specific exonuclease